LSTDDQQKQMRKLRDQAIFETDPQAKRRAIDALATHRKKSLNLLQEVMDSTDDDSFKAYVLSKIKEVRIFSPPGS
jgi:hypothetical protein